MSQHLHHHIKLHQLHFTEINELYIALSLQAFSVGLVGIFIPIYLYNLGFPLFHIAMFFTLFSIFTLLPFPIVSQLVLKKGPKHVIMLSFVIMFLYIAFLYLLPLHKYLLYQTAIVGGLAEGVFWIGRHMDLTMILNRKKAASQFSVLLIFSTIAQAASPLVGGVIASAFGIQYALLGTAIGLLFAIYPLRKTPDAVNSDKTTFRFLRTAPARHLLANFANNAQSTAGIFLWPLFIYFVVKTYENVGIIATLSLLLCVATLYLMTRFADKGKAKDILAAGSTVRVFGHIARALSRSFPTVLGANILGDVGDTIECVPYAAHFYREARERGTASYLTDMEIAACLGKIVPWLLLVDLVIYFDVKIALVMVLILAAFLTPLLRLIGPSTDK